MLTRRDFLSASSACAGAAALGPAWLARAARAPRDPCAAERVLVVIELRGGNDGLDTLIPFEDDVYHRLRPALAKRDGLHRVDDLNRLHPALERTARRFAAGQALAIQQVGYAPTNLSHFESQDIWHEGSTAALRAGRGWLGAWRDAGSVPAEDAALDLLALGDAPLPLALRGRGPLPPAVRALPGFRLRGYRGAGPEAEREDALRLAALRAVNSAPTDDPALDLVQTAFAGADAACTALARAAAHRSAVSYPGTALARNLRSVAAVIASGLTTRVFHVVHDGFDTHTDQARDHPRLLAELDQAVDALLEELAQLNALERTLVLTTSEFGRRVAENGSGVEAGTDHGAASVLLLYGGKLRGGVLGGQPRLDALDANGNLPVAIDFRRVYASVIEGWLGGDAAAVLGERFEPLELFSA
jgi:uncharacterized protein (DUF1501 family)